MTNRHIEKRDIAEHIVALGRNFFTLNSCLQILAISIVSVILAYKDASDRAGFLAESNQHTLGLMLSTGDTFQLKNILSSLKTIDTPKIWLLDVKEKDVLRLVYRRRNEKNVHEEIGPHFKIENSELFMTTESPIIYNNMTYGKLILQNKIKLVDWSILCAAILFLTLLFSFIQRKQLEKFALKLAFAVSGLRTFFAHAQSKEEIDQYAIRRAPTEFNEVELMAKELVKLLSDILKSSEFEREKEKYKTIAQISSHVAHDLRHPISIIDAVTRARNWVTFEGLRPELGRAMNRVEDMIEGLRNSDTEKFFRIIENQLDLNILASDLRPVVSEKKALIRCEGESTLIDAAMDQQKMIRVFNNLIFNALEAGATEVVLRSNLAEDRYLIEVLDNGPGVPKEFISKLFTLGETFGKVGGSGLGLSWVKKAIEAHSGSIEYKRLNGHTLFQISLPCLRTSSKDPEVSTDLPAQNMTRKLRANSIPRLFININEADLQYQIKYELERKGITVTENAVDMEIGDLLYTNSDDHFAKALDQNVSAIIHQSGNLDLQTILKQIVDRLEIMNLIWERANHEK